MSTIAFEPQPQQHNSTFVTMQQPETAKNVRVYLNGDKFFPGRRFVVNRRHISNFDGFLNQVTFGIKAPFGAVRNIYTPTSGHRVNGLEQLQNGMDLVAGGNERFRKLEYKEIGTRKRPPPRRTAFDLTHHSQRMNVSARWRKYIKDPCQIYVYGNGDMNAPAVKLLLIPRLMKTWDLVLQEVTEKISLRTGQAVRKLYDMDFHLLGDPSELENGHYYVAVGTEKLKKYPYGEIPIGIQHSPRRNNATLPPIRKNFRPKPPKEDDPSYTKLYARRKKPAEQQDETTTVMGASAATGYRPLRVRKTKPQKTAVPPTHEGETVFHAKPVKVKRSGNRAQQDAQQVPADESDAVFRGSAKQVKAQEVEEDDNLKVDLPIDQVVASTVEEEEVAEVLPPADDGKVEEEGRRSRNEEEDDRVASAKIDEPSEEERTAGFVNLDRSTDGQVEEDIAAEDDRSAVNSPRETVPLQSEPEKENDDETDVVRRDDEEARDGVVEELEAGKTSPEEDPSKENESLTPQPAAGAIVDETTLDDADSATDGEISERSNKEPTETKTPEPSSYGKPNAKSSSPDPVRAAEASQQDEQPGATITTLIDSLPSEPFPDDRSKSPDDEEPRAASSAAQQGPGSRAETAETPRHSDEYDAKSRSPVEEPRGPDEDNASKAAEEPDNERSSVIESNASPAPGNAQNEADATLPLDASVENAKSERSVAQDEVSNAGTANETGSQNEDSTPLKASDESNDGNLFTPSSPRSGTRPDADDRSNVDEDEDPQDNQDRPVDDGLGVRGDVPGTDQVSVQSSQDPDATTARPDSNALATDDDQQAAILKNTHSIPNGTAAGAHGLQP